MRYLTEQEYADIVDSTRLSYYAKGRIEESKIDVSVYEKSRLIEGYPDFYKNRGYTDLSHAWDHYVMSLELLQTLNGR